MDVGLFGEVVDGAWDGEGVVGDEVDSDGGGWVGWREGEDVRGEVGLELRRAVGFAGCGMPSENDEL